MFYRRKLVLAVLEEKGKPLTADALHQLLLSIAQQRKKPSYDFVPVRGKCFSFQLQHDLEIMSREGTIDVEGGAYRKRNAEGISIQLTPADRVLLSRMGRAPVDCAVQAMNDATPALFTIGYEGRSLENYLRALLQQNVTVLCDVRKNAFSMKFGFSKHQLKPACEAVGIRYEHIPDLGIESDLRKGIVEKDKLELFRNYAEHTLPENIEAVNAVLRLIRSGERVALTCFEARECDCHRGPLSALIEKMSGGKFCAHHL